VRLPRVAPSVELTIINTVSMRAKRVSDRRPVVVAQSLPLVALDESGFLDSDGEVHRHFYWDISVTANDPAGAV
jgi:hypothetical protein